jgi:hypothetical protein
MACGGFGISKVSTSQQGLLLLPVYSIIRIRSNQKNAERENGSAEWAGNSGVGMGSDRREGVGRGSGGSGEAGFLKRSAFSLEGTRGMPYYGFSISE